MPFTEENKPLLEEALFMNFQFMKNGRVNYHKHSKRELGLYFIKKAVEVHGNKYGYSKVSYIDSHTKVTVTCGQHGDFEQVPKAHIDGQACPKCANSLKTSTTNDFIAKAREVHGDRYDYSSVQYKKSTEKVSIICLIHGSFEQTPEAHKRGHGCPNCSNESLKLTTEDFIAKAREVHGDRYDYSSVQYKNNKEKVKILCPLHSSFFQTPNHHLMGKGCSQCAGNTKNTTEEFIKRARDVHGDRYDYSSVQYKSMHEKVEILCHLHGSFHTPPANHIRHGTGCPRCAGKNHDILYLLKCLETGWYKIGITTDNVQKRIASIGGNLKEVYHVVLEDPRKHESILHKRYAKDREYNLCVRGGHTEFFSLTEEQVQEVIDYMNEVSSNA